ncbi:MAG: hypothetical protein GY927_18800, partial [bacterium]|nr:hypothetical protein [bacterium]
LLAERSAICLVPGWPADSLPDSVWDTVDNRPLALLNQFPLDYKSLMNCALGQPTKAFGPDFIRYDGTVPMPRLPNPPYQFVTRVTELEATMGKPTEGSYVETLYDIPEDAWYFQENAGVMPFCVLMEIAMQPSGWLAAVNLDADERPVPHLLFRNLDGQGTLFRTITPEDKTIRTTTRLTSHAKMGETIIVKFEVHCFSGSEELFTLDTAFGFFPPSAFINQKGLGFEEHELALIQQDDNIDINLSEQEPAFLGDNSKLPGSQLRMLDRITGYWPQGGKAGKGQWRAEKIVDPGDWYFKAHFYSDPVQPGSLGVEGILQLIQNHMLHKKRHSNLKKPHFEPCLLNNITEWHFRGQVVPDDDKVVFDIEILQEGDLESGYYVEAEGRLWVNNKKIYQVPRIGLRLIEGKEQPELLIIEKVQKIPPVKLGPLEVKATTKKEHFLQYIEVVNNVFRGELGQNYPAPNEDKLSNEIVVVGLRDDSVVGGL